MRIRNMQEYRAFVSGSIENNFEIASKDDKFLTQIKGVPRSSIKKYVENIAGFATNIHVQSIYELIQNAGDAKACQMYIFYDEDNFLLINTGESFITQGVKQEVKGEFFDFLRKGEGVHDEGDMGKYGQGSKLLYALIPSLNDDKIENALVERKEGLIVYSWSELTGSLTELLNWNIHEEPIQPTGYQDNLYPLFTKILYTYFPVHPFEKGICSGENELSELFSKKEVERFINFLKKSYNLIENKSALRQGTVMYLPLGKGHDKKFDVIREKIEQSIGATLHFVSPLEKVTISNTITTNTLRKSINFYDRKIETSQILIPKDFTKEQEAIPNFYKFLPITDEVHNFKFYINNKNFDITADRQHFKDGVEENLLTQIAEDLSTYIKDIKEINSENINLFISILCSEPQTSKSDKNDYFNKIFYTQYLLEALKTNIPTSKNNFLSSEKVGINKTELEINPIDLGINIEWINELLHNYTFELGLKLGVKGWNIISLLKNENLNPEKLQTWISSLSKEDYTNFLEKISKNYSKEINSIEFLKGSDGNFYSVEEFENKDIIILTENLKSLEKSLQKAEFPYLIFAGCEEMLFGQEIEDYETNLFDKLISLFNENKEKLTHTEKHAIITVFNELYPDEINKIKTKLHIFQNQNKEYKPLNQLLSNASLYASGWLVDLQLLASEKNPLLEQYLMKENEIWDYVCANLPFQNKIKESYFIPFYEQLEEIHNLKRNSKAILEDKAFIFVGGSFKLRSEVFWNEDLKGFSKTDFTVFKSFVERNTNLVVPAQEHIEAINREFFELENDTSEVIKDTLNENIERIEVSEQEVKILYKIDEDLLDTFILFEENKTYYLKEKIKNKDIQYFVNAENKKIIEYLDKKKDYFWLPAKFTNLFLNIILPINSLVSKFGSELEFRCAFIDKVIESNAAIQIDFINKIDKLEIDSNEKYDSDSYEYKLLQLAASSRDTEKEYIRSRTYIDSKIYSHYQYSEEINFVNGNSIIATAKFRLSEILTEFEGISNIVEKLKIIFQGIDWIQNSFFETKRITANEVFNKLAIQKINSYDQMAFAMFHVQSIENYTTKIDTFFSATFIPQSEKVLKICYKYRILNIQNIYSILSYPNYTYIFYQEDIDKKFLLLDEIVPSWIYEWIKEDKQQEEEKYSYLFLIGFKKEGKEVIAFRNSINEKDTQLPHTLTVNKVFIDNTFKWIYSQISEKILDSQSNVYKNTSQLMKAYADKHNSLPPYLWQIFFLDAKTTKYKLAKESELMYFSNVKKEPNKQLLWKGCQKENITFFDFSDSDLAKKLGKIQLSVGNRFDTTNTEANQEWQYEAYKVWKKEEPTPTYTIYNPEQKVPYTYFLEQNGNPFHDIETISDKDEAFDKTKKAIYITQTKASEPKAILEVLETKSSQDEWFKNADEKNELMKLMKLVMREMFKPIDTPPQNPDSVYLGRQLTNEQVSILKDLLEKYGEKDLKKLQIPNPNSVDLGKQLTTDQVSALKELLDKYGEDNLKNLEAEIKDTIEENTTHAYRQIIGYVGEQLILQGLQHGENKYTDLKQISEKDNFAGYDIIGTEADSTPIYFEVKTTVGTIKENSNSVALKLGVTQYNFIMDNKTENYHLVRVSLEDMNLAHIAREFKEREFTNEVKTKIQGNVRKALKDNPNLLEKYDKTAILFFKLSYSKIAEVMQDK